MKAINGHHKVRQDHWQTGFLKMLPQIEQLLKHVFVNLDPASREEAVQDAIVNCLLSYARLHARGRANVASASSLVWYAALQIRSGRTAAGHLNTKEPLSRYAQLRRGIKVTQLQSWIDTVIEDKRSPILDVVAARLDIRAWLASLCRRTRQIACDLAKGHSTADTASKYGVTPGRISQIRRELELSWKLFQHEIAPAPAA